MINFPDLAVRLQKYRVTKDEDMPEVYRQGQRPIHDDWGIPSLPSAMQPWTKIPRIWTAYKVPVPFKRVAGNQEPGWERYLEGYPLAPDAQVQLMPIHTISGVICVPHVLTMHPVGDIGTWSRQAAWIDGTWRECFYTSSRKFFGKKLITYYIPYFVKIIC